MNPIQLLQPAPPAANALQTQLQALRAAYAARLPEKAARLRELCRPVLQETDANADGATADISIASFDSETRQLAHRLAHNLAGSGATYGFTTVSTAARHLELTLVKNGENAVTVQDKEEICAAYQALQSAIDSLAGGGASRVLASDDAPLSKNDIRDGDGASTLPDVAPQTSSVESWHQDLQAAHSENKNRLIFLASPGGALGEEIAQQIGYFGYTVRTFALDEKRETADALCRALVRDEPAALLINESPRPDKAKNLHGDASHNAFALAERVGEMRRDSTAPPLPIVFFSHCTDMATRLQAVRAGGTAYFTHPIEISEVIDKLDALTAQEIPEPYRILVVDDDPELSSFFALTMCDAGLSTRTVNDPLEIIGALNDFRPDLILMDVYMPTCSGLELATAIRQQEDYLGIPIVFLSAETDVEKQLAAIGTGGDDFLTKPIRPDHLVASVRARAQRSRAVRSFMVRDSLTGLLNHTTTKEQIDIEISRAARTQTPLSLVMLDIDHFKSVNDSHGHLAGDRVIKGLSRLLQQRLRKTDIIGRYGGEEFAMLLPDTDAETAQRVLDEIRRGFAQIRHGATGGEFRVTFSAGIAAFPQCADAATLSAAADKALYEAKNAGRDRVVISSVE